MKLEVNPLSPNLVISRMNDGGLIIYSTPVIVLTPEDTEALREFLNEPNATARPNW